MTGDERYTGAAARGNLMIIITVRVEGMNFVVCEDASARLVMEDRSQEEMRRFAAALDAFVERTGVEKIVLRSAPPKGDYAAHPRVYKMEAALQLHPKLQVAMSAPATLNKWERYSGGVAPEVHPNVTTAHEKALHQEAITAACLSAIGWPDVPWHDCVK